MKYSQKCTGNDKKTQKFPVFKVSFYVISVKSSTNSMDWNVENVDQSKK